MLRRLLLTACIFCWTLAVPAQEYNTTKNISSANGLINDFVINMAIDGQGYVWAATEAGLSRIAGETCQTFPYNKKIDGQRISSIIWHEQTGLMVIGTYSELTLYHPQTGETRILTTQDGVVASTIDKLTLSKDKDLWLIYGNGQVQRLNCTTLTLKNLKLDHLYRNRCALDDGEGHLYIGHSQHGMSIVNLNTGTTRHFEHHPDNEHSLPGNNVRIIYQDAQKRIWVGTDNGLALYHPRTGTFQKVILSEKENDYNVYDILQARDGKLWVASDIGGIYILSQFDKLQFDSQQKINTTSLNTRCLVQDEFGNIWVGNHSTGVDFFSFQKSDFSFLEFGDKKSNRYPVYAIAPDTDANSFWTAGEDELMRWQGDKVIKYYTGYNKRLRKNTSARCLLVDHSGYVWIGINDYGVVRFDKQKEKVEKIPISPDGLDILSFEEDKNGGIWIGGEVAVYHYSNGKVTMQEAISQTIKAPVIYFQELGHDNLFVATLGDGAYLFNLANGSHKHLNIGNGLPSDKINQVIRDNRDGLWLGTNGGLVYLSDPLTLTGVKTFSTPNGLADCHVLALGQDRFGRIWMSTYSGISCFDDNTGSFHNYNHLDTHMTGGFSIGAAINDSDGNLYFGSAMGVCYFNPQQINDKSELSIPQIISCEAYNPVDMNTEIQHLTPDEKGRVYTNYTQNTLRLSFTVRNFDQTNHVEYSYMMKGMDGKWYDIDNDHDVVFRGLRPGHYTFILRAKLKSQEWDKAKRTQLTIIITPPFWLTWWAYILYGLLAITIAALFARAYKRKLAKRSIRELEHRESLQKQQLNEERLRFFTNITHELRTPLTLILGPIEDLMDDAQLPQQYRSRVAMIQKSAERLRSLISDILEFRKTETQNRRLTVASGDIGQFVREIYLNFKELNRNPKVQYHCKIAEHLPTLWFDSEVITTVMNNLLSNAIKYTEQGSITTTVKADHEHVFISVADTGYGISPNALPHVFERYYQAKGNHQASGTGIGLALVKSLADLHEADIHVDSQEGSGSCFTLTLSINNTYPNALHKEETEHVAAKAGDGVEDTAIATAEQLPLLLIVEDNEDIRQYIADSSSDDFRIIQASNGEEGLQIAREQIPDIIVSDIMMPKMNGIELTRQLKEDIRTSHIPIILLTAKTTDEDREDGYNSGADSYLTKPFTAKLLGSRIRNLLNARRRLAEFISGNSGPVMLPDRSQPSETTDGTPSQCMKLGHLDQKFIERLNALIEENIMQENIDIAFITDKLAMSHSTFYRKVKALTGMTAIEYIRKRRLRHCYQLLESGEYNVNQAALMTGFNQMAYFREIFKKEFGILPSDVKRK